MSVAVPVTAKDGAASGGARERRALPPGHPSVDTGPSAASAASPSQGSVPRPAGEFAVAGMRFRPPAEWVSQRVTAQFRAYQFLLPHAEGDAQDGVLTVSQPIGGTVEQNIERWRGGDFEGAPEARTESLEVSGMDVTLVWIEGTFLDKPFPQSPDKTPRPGYKLLAAIVQAPEGQSFFKAWGPKATMDRWEADFAGMVKTLEPLR